MARCRLPELDAMALRIGDPSEAPVLVLMPLVRDLYALGTQLREERVEIIEAVVKHERGVARTEVGRVLLEERPHGGADASRIVAIAPFEYTPATLFDGNAEMAAVPVGERV